MTYYKTFFVHKSCNVAFLRFMLLYSVALRSAKLEPIEYLRVIWCNIPVCLLPDIVFVTYRNHVLMICHTVTTP